MFCNLHPAQLSGKVGEIWKKDNPNLVSRLRSVLFISSLEDSAQTLTKVSFLFASGLGKYSNSGSGSEKLMHSVLGTEKSLGPINSWSGSGLKKFGKKDNNLGRLNKIF